jgi:hypothetical protein
MLLQDERDLDCMYADKSFDEEKLFLSFDFTFGYKDDVLLLNNSRFGDFADRIYLNELEIKDTTDTNISASYLDSYLNIDSDRRLRTKLFDQRYYFNFLIVNFPFICRNIESE